MIPNKTEEGLMDSGNKFMVVASVVIVALVLQVVLIIADRHDSPGKAAVEFSKAYFKQNECMAYRLCSDVIADEEIDVVGDYINRVADEARADGYKPRWMRMALSHTEVEVEMLDENTADVHLTGHSMRSVNPVFGLVSKLFLLGESYDVDETLTVIKEADGWKVCGQPYSLVEG
jgi:hypothetical protein